MRFVSATDFIEHGALGATVTRLHLGVNIIDAGAQLRVCETHSQD
jgi:hypothetical protein